MTQPRIVLVDDHSVDLPPARNLLVVRNDDRPGMVGVVGSALGAAKVNIIDMSLGRSPGGGTALMVLSTAEEVPAAVIDELRGRPGILEVAAV